MIRSVELALKWLFIHLDTISGLRDIVIDEEKVIFNLFIIINY